MTHASRAHGTHGSGSRDFTTSDAEAVWLCLQAAKCDLTVDQLVHSTGINGRTVRAVLSDGDGRWGLLAGGDDGYHIARDQDDAEGLTRRLESQARKMLERATRRRTYGARLAPRAQATLFV